MLLLRHPISLLLIVLLVLLGVLRSFSTPSPVDAGAPDVVFSADRAEAILRELLPEKLPHVAGSEQNTVVRKRIIEQLRSAGYEPEVQSRFHCNPMYGTCSPVENILAIKRGATGRHAVLLTAHYDSAPAGSGAADDGAAVAAILEIARMAADFPAFANDIIFLLTDSEENGLIGADAFAEYHPMFDKVRAVINLEARGVTGPSGMFETGEGNRSVIRMLSKNVDRPVATSLLNEIYRRMPNDTDFSVYKRRGLMGVNFAFAEGVALYHSVLDDVDHLDLGSLQHHGDNAWGMLKAFGERDLTTIRHAEDAGYIDLFGLRLAHYPVSIAGGLALFLGVWVMLAIGLAFRKEFRYRQLRWGLLAMPLMLAAIVLGGYLLSWPLGRWPEMHPLEHPYPWVGRLTLLLMTVTVGYGVLRLFAGRVSACAWMILAWASVFIFTLVLTAKVPSVAHIGLLPLAFFALGSVIDLFRRKSPAPLLLASLLGFAATAFVSLYHFLLLDLAVNFDRSHVKVIPLWLVSLSAMPMLLAYVRNRELTWRPVRWFGAAILLGSVVHFSLPGFTEQRPRDMTLMYSEVAGQEHGHIVLESLQQEPDLAYARSHDFEYRELNDGRLGTVSRPAREVAALDLPDIPVAQLGSEKSTDGWKRTLRIDVPPLEPFVQVVVGEEAGLLGAFVNGLPALDSGIEAKQRRKIPMIRLIHPPAGPVEIELLTRSADPVRVAIVTWHELPGVLTAPFMGNWPDDARPAFLGPRAVRIQELTLTAAD